MQATSEVERPEFNVPSADRGRQLLYAATIFMMCAATVVNTVVVVVAAPTAMILGAGSAPKGKRLFVALLAFLLVVACMFLGATPMGAREISR